MLAKTWTPAANGCLYGMEINLSSTCFWFRMTVPFQFSMSGVVFGVFLKCFFEFSLFECSGTTIPVCFICYFHRLYVSRTQLPGGAAGCQAASMWQQWFMGTCILIGVRGSTLNVAESVESLILKGCTDELRCATFCSDGPPWGTLQDT